MVQPPPGPPGAFPLPAPVQALKDAATQTNPAVPAVAGTVATEDHHGAKPKVGVARRTRKARLRLSRLDPWSVMKTSFLFSIAAGIMLVASIYSIWAVLSTSQLFDSLNEIVRSVVSTPGDTTPFRIQEYINTQKVMGVTALIACVDVVIFTALATLGSFLYNLAATMLGGLEITLAED
jgi:flagellar biosynthesis protein FlhB